MDVGLILSAALIGFSFSNSFMCTVIAMSTSMGKGFKAGIGFIMGRFAGILLLGLVLALFGFYIEIDTQMMLYIFGSMTLLFGLAILVFPRMMSRRGILRGCEVGDCEECEDEKVIEGHDCSNCSQHSGCDKKGKLDTRGGIESGFQKNKGIFGVLGVASIGAVRGATPCIKIMLLLPLMISLPFLQSIAVTSTYALSSSLYPVAGIAIASIVGDLSTKRIRKYLSRTGALIMIGVGIYFLYKAWNYSCSSGV